MDPATLTQLVEDTLYARRMVGHEAGSCMVHNQAAVELRGVGVAATPEIERAIRAVVVPAAADFGDAQALHRRFWGLRELWMVYLTAPGEDQLVRVVGFLRSIPAVLVQTALQAVASVWVMGQKRDRPIPEALLTFAQELAADESHGASEKARWLLRRKLGGPPTSARRDGGPPRRPN